MDRVGAGWVNRFATSGDTVMEMASNTLESVSGRGREVLLCSVHF